MMNRTYAVFLLIAFLTLALTACSSGNPTNTNTPIASAPNTNGTFTSTNNPGAPNTGPATQPANANANPGGFTELIMLYSQLFTARARGDKAKAEGLLADDFKETTGDGKTLTKAQVLAAIDPNKKSSPYSLEDLRSTGNDETGTVTGRVIITSMEGKPTESWQFSTTFSKKGGRWQAVSNKITNYKKQ